MLDVEQTDEIAGMKM